MENKQLEKIRMLARDFTQQGQSEALAVGDFVETLLDSFGYDGTPQDEALEIIKISLEELKGNCDLFIKLMSEATV